MEMLYAMFISKVLAFILLSIRGRRTSFGKLDCKTETPESTQRHYCDLLMLYVQEKYPE